MKLCVIIAHYMAERIHIVVPDGTTKKLIEKAKVEGHTKSSYARKVLLAALKEQTK